ncbi:MAG: Fe-S protein assembly co-chaperone HscB [Pseudomonadota bacterium]
MEFDFTQNYFELLGLGVNFQIDENKLAENYQQLQSQFHPDRFTNSSDQDKRVAMQATTFINEANKTLSDHQMRARYLLELAGVHFDVEKDTTQDMKFLMSQMSLREEIDEVDSQEDPLEKLDQLALNAKQQKKQLTEEFLSQYNDQVWDQAKDTVLKMQFFNRLQQQINLKQEALEDELL